MKIALRTADSQAVLYLCAALSNIHLCVSPGCFNRLTFLEDKLPGMEDIECPGHRETFFS